MITILGATGNVGSKIAEYLIMNKTEDIRLVSRTAGASLPCLLKKSSAGVTSYADVQSFDGDIEDFDFLVEALKGSDSVFTLIPPNMKADSHTKYAEDVIDKIARAVEATNVKFVVNLSSVGADLAEGTGLISYLHKMEERLNSIKGLNVLHVRAGYFMENLVMNIDRIRTREVISMSLRGDLKIPMIATEDIARFIGERLEKRDFTGSSIQYLLGERDISMTEAASIIGKRIGMRDLTYFVVPYDEAEKELVEAGVSPDVSHAYLEMIRAFNEGRIAGTFKRTKSNTTAIKLETFIDGVFVPEYGQKKAA